MWEFLSKFWSPIAISLLAVMGGPENVWIIIIASLIAILGGLVSFLNENNSFNWYGVIKKIVTAAFVGGLSGCACIYAKVGIFGAAVAGGVLGWMGVEALVWAKKVLHKKTNTEIDPPKPNNTENK